MTSDIKPIDSHWQQTTLEFRAYLRQTIELLHKPKIVSVDTPLPANPRKARSRKQTQLKPKQKLSSPAPLVPADKEQTVFKPSSARRYSSPLWIGIGDENPGRSNVKTKRTKKAK